MSWWLLGVGVGVALLINLGHEVVKDRRQSGEWIWQTWRRERGR